MMCFDRNTSKCASQKEMSESWKHLKKRLKEYGLTKQGGVLRLKGLCFGICKGGPLMVVYPEGVWYGQCNPEVIDLILQKHLIEGEIVKEYQLGQSPFSGTIPQETNF
ncbi:Ferredoxin [Planctomycetales bacterium 10988]|nr:Ferredoxin [Planctomycetales bacterium 10988]